ncbi:hypothetical protein CLPU_6c00270 [Gottschalkia purinilytica]|uniref:Uncharacterized protein n=1 Tax=Gottschalkia purinilytica TaxID=1503 RepID=A0A0L0WAM6_GOTPU|nr:hypothetical protein [Gottschalkia purinilytica]KNF08541.1 hypothetical protein CLPU_6c00270 [Gottschalkia purinilytica]
MKLTKLTEDKLLKAIYDLSFIKTKIEEALKMQHTSFEESICKEYIKVQNVAEVANIINNKGHTIQNRKFIGKDISNIVKNTKDSSIGKIAKALFDYNNTLQNKNRSLSKLIKSLRN